jgi:CheY-like chemotaxis protein
MPFITLLPQRSQILQIRKECSVMPCILVIDDEQPVRAVLRQMLEKAGYRVEEAPDGTVGMDLLRSHSL